MIAANADAAVKRDGRGIMMFFVGDFHRDGIVGIRDDHPGQYGFVAVCAIFCFRDFRIIDYGALGRNIRLGQCLCEGHVLRPAV